MNGLCRICLNDGIERKAVRKDVLVKYPVTGFPVRNDGNMRFDLCEEHMDMALSPDNEIEVLDEGRA